MAYWRDMATPWAADEPLHAGICRGMQDNATVLGEQAKSDLASSTLGSSYSQVVPGANWAWSALLPRPTRALKSFNGAGWRDISVELLCAITAAGVTTMRLYLLPVEVAPEIDAATGDVGTYDYVTLNPAAAPPVYHGGAITPSAVQWRTIEGVTFPIVWVHLAHAGNTNVRIYDLRITEDSA